MPVVTLEELQRSTTQVGEPGDKAIYRDGSHNLSFMEEWQEENTFILIFHLPHAI